MTVIQAREILGEEIESLSDKEVEEMIDRDFRLCDVLLEVIMASPDAELTNYEGQN